MIEKYIHICNLLDQTGPLSPRLDLVQKLIQAPDFKYQKESFPGILTDTLAQSAYWLHIELFNETNLHQKDFKSIKYLFKSQ